MADDLGSDGGSKLQPPYTSFQSIKTALAQFKEHATPDRIDRSVLTNFSGAVGSQILTAFRFLGLIDQPGHPTAAMKGLVKSVGTDDWPLVLETVVRSAYAPIFELNLATCSPSQFIERFKRSYSGADDVTRKSITFFLNAASEAKIPVSSFIMKARKPRSAPVKKRPPRNSDDKKPRLEEEEIEEVELEAPSHPPPAQQFIDKLLEKFPALDPEWSDEVKAKWFEAFRELMASADKGTDK